MGKNEKARRARKLLKRLNFQNRNNENAENNEENIQEELVQVVENEEDIAQEDLVPECKTGTDINIKVTKEDEFRYRQRFPEKKADPKKKEAMREARINAELAEIERKEKYLDAVSKKLREQDER